MSSAWGERFFSDQKAEERTGDEHAHIGRRIVDDVKGRGGNQRKIV